MNNIVVYRYIRLDKDQPFYIGIGTLKRARDAKWGRSEYFKRICNKYGVELEIVEDDLDWNTAAQKEIWWIKFYGREDIGTGILINMTDGGEGRYGYVTPSNVIQKIKDTKAKNGQHPMLGKTHTPEARAKISIGNMGKKMSQESIDKRVEKQKGRICTSEQRERMSQGQLKREPFSDQHRQKLSESSTGREVSEEVRLRISNKLKGHLVTDKTKESLRKANSKPIINTITREIYNSVKSAIKASGLTDNKFTKRLTGRVKDTSFSYKYIDT